MNKREARILALEFAAANIIATNDNVDFDDLPDDDREKVIVALGELADALQQRAAKLRANPSR